MRSPDRRFDELSEVQSWRRRNGGSLNAICGDGGTRRQTLSRPGLRGAAAFLAAEMFRRCSSSRDKKQPVPANLTLKIALIRTALTAQTYSRRASPQEPPALCQPLEKAESSTLDFKTMTSNAENNPTRQRAATVQPPKPAKRADVVPRNRRVAHGKPRSGKKGQLGRTAAQKPNG